MYMILVHTHSSGINDEKHETQISGPCARSAISFLLFRTLNMISCLLPNVLRETLSKEI